MNLLETETSFYADKKEEYLRDYKNRFLLIKGKELFGDFSTQKEALEVGIENFGIVSFLIKHVVEEETRFTAPALTLGLMDAGR